MKNLFFALVFMLIGTFAFGGNMNSSSVEVDLNEDLVCGFELSWQTDGPYGSGSSWFDCDGWDMDDIMYMIEEMFF
ncbi:hypothetical protein [Joostella sp. CR20]|uniref:hypothetical protein n=1 Tax=Joostella sp. CR20 TaxID=2804312 RepID=UPI00313CF10F